MRRSERRKELKAEMNDLYNKWIEDLADYSNLKISKPVFDMEVAETRRKIAKARLAVDATFEPII
jgi:deoxyadenosine/deoxycytidine kinase